MTDYRPLTKEGNTFGSINSIDVESAYKGMREALFVKLAFCRKQEDLAILEDSYETAARYHRGRVVCLQTVELLDLWFGAAFEKEEVKK